MNLSTSTGILFSFITTYLDNLKLNKVIKLENRAIRINK